MKSLANREFHVRGNWYAPLSKLKEYSSVVNVALYDTTSSAGDWSGFLVQKMGKKRYDLILFNQYNNWPSESGFNVHTTLLCQCNSKLTNEEIYKLIEEMPY